MKIDSKPAKNGGVDLTIACDCGKLITKANKYGMFCEDFCGLEEAKKADKQLNKLLKGLDKLFGDLK